MTTTNTLKVLGVTAYGRLPSGNGWYDTRICEELALRGHDVTLLALGGIDPALLRRPSCIRVLDAAPRAGRGCGFVENADGSVRPSALQRFIVEMRTFRRAFSLVNRSGYSVAHFFEAHPLTLLLAIRLFLSKSAAATTTLVMHAHYAGKIVPSKGFLRRFSTTLYRRLLLTLIREHIQGVIVMDSSLKDDLCRYLRLGPDLSSRVLLIPHGMDVPDIPYDRTEARNRLNITGEEPLLLLFGILRRAKGIETAIQAMRTVPCARLLIFGKVFDWPSSSIEEFIRQSGCQSRISLNIGYVEEQRIQDYFLAADAVLVPYTKAFKGQSGILTRSCSYGRAVIATDVGAIGETVRANGIGLVVEPENPPALGQAILAFLELRPEERRQMESEAKSLARCQSWAAVAEQIERHYLAIEKSCPTSRKEDEARAITQRAVRRERQ